MSDKETAIDEVTPLDEYPLMEEGARKEEFLAGIREALAEVERGETYTLEEVRASLREWVRQ